MITRTTYFRIQHEFRVEKRSLDDIAQRLDLDKKTVSKWIGCSDFTYKKRFRKSKLDAFKPVILKLLKEEGLSAERIFPILKDKGYAGGNTILQVFIKRNRPRFPLKPREFHAHQWMHRIMQGGVGLAELQRQFTEKLNPAELEILTKCIEAGRLRARNQAVAVLAFHKGIQDKIVSRFLLVHARTVAAWRRLLQSQGVERLIGPRRVKQQKSDLPEFQEAVFSILHAPPTEYGFNRTSWRIDDILHVMRIKGLELSRDAVREIIRNAGYRFRKARRVLTSNDPDYRVKLQAITSILRDLKTDEKFFSVDEFGPFAIKKQGGRCRTKPDEMKTVPQYQKSKGSLILTAALELSENQVTHFYSEKKNTDEMLKLLEMLLLKYADQTCIYFSWDAASWHASKRFIDRVEEINSSGYRAERRIPLVKLAPLPACAQFLNVIESVFSGMAKAIIHNSDYQSVQECKSAIDRYFAERNQHFKDDPKRAGNKIWGKERVPPIFTESNNCKDPRYQNRLH